MRLCDRVIVRERVQNKSHDHVQKPRALYKAWTVSELALTPIRWTLVESKIELVFRHCLKTITTKVVRKLNPGDMKHIHNNLWCDDYMRTSIASNEMRYRIIESMHVGVKLLDQHGWTSDRGVTVAPIPYCRWQWVGRCRRSSTRWLGVQNECLVEKSAQRSLIWPSHHGTRQRKE